MKKLYSKVLFIAVILSPSFIFAQLNNGGINAFFGIDGDTKGNFVKYGPATGLIPTDDWFSGNPLGKNVIDTSNASLLLSLLQGGANIGFNKRMSVPLYTKLNGKLWLDAVYGRDYVSTSSLVDSTAFTFAAKNGDNPGNWVGGITNFPDKDDLTDVFAHMRRDGTNVHDSLWFFTGVSTVGTSGSRYFDIELYKNNFGYNSTTGVFTTAGPDAGHTQWKFDASGNVTQTGDLIVAVNYTPGTAPVVDVRIWVSANTFATVTPAYFEFGPAFNGATAAFGYASILSKSGSTAFGAGIANFSATPANDTTFSTPWGTEISTKVWGAQYQSLQFVEIGLNMTRIGVDPALYSTLSPCESLFSDIFFKSRSSNSFSSNMQDFAGPLQFLMTPVMDYSLTPDTLRCNKQTGTITITNNSTAGYYTWKSLSGNISGSNSDSSQININKPGTYIVSAAPIAGCPVTRTDTVTIPIDTFPPVASITAGITPDLSTLLFHGGNVAASNYLTPFGGSQGLLWDWSGPGGFASTIQNPTNDTAWGTYQLIVTEKRNGCKDTATITLHKFDFVILASKYLILSGQYNNQSVTLRWLDQTQNSIDHYEIEKSFNGIDFIKSGSTSVYSFTDANPGDGNIIYRIKAVAANGQIIFSNIISVHAGIKGHQQFYVGREQGSRSMSIIYHADKDFKGTIVLYNSIGQQFQNIPVQMQKGENIIQLPINEKFQSSVIIVSLFVDNKLAFTQKTIE